MKNIEPLGIGLRKPKNMDITELFEEGTKKGLKGHEVPCPNYNPQRLCMDELQKRIWNLPDPNDHFRGGAYSGD
jgi:hypothetical protein